MCAWFLLNKNARDMAFGPFFDGRVDGKHNSVGLVEIPEIFAKQYS